MYMCMCLVLILKCGSGLMPYRSSMSGLLPNSRKSMPRVLAEVSTPATNMAIKSSTGSSSPIPDSSGFSERRKQSDVSMFSIKRNVLVMAVKSADLKNKKAKHPANVKT